MSDSSASYSDKRSAPHPLLSATGGQAKRQKTSTNMANSSRHAASNPVYPGFEDGTLMSSSEHIFGADNCIVCHKTSGLEDLLHLPCKHLIHQACFQHVLLVSQQPISTRNRQSADENNKVDRPGCVCPTCRKPVRYKMCGHAVWYQNITLLKLGTERTFDGVCPPCGGTELARHMWNVVERAQPDFVTSRTHVSLSHFIECEHYQKEPGSFGIGGGGGLDNNAIMFPSPDDRPPVEQRVRSRKAYPQEDLAPLAQLPFQQPGPGPLQAAAAPMTEDDVAGLRHMLWHCIVDRYDEKNYPTTTTSHENDHLVHVPSGSLADLHANRLDHVVAKRGEATEYATTMDLWLGGWVNMAAAAAPAGGLAVIQERLRALGTNWRQLEVCWLQLRRLDREDGGNGGAAFVSLVEKDQLATRQAWVRQLHTTVNVAVQFCSLPGVKCPWWTRE